MLTLDTYLEAPCRHCSIPYWKFQQISIPDTMAIVHGSNFHPGAFPGYTDTPYFRLLHRLDHIPAITLQETELVTASAADIPTIADIINRSYSDLSVTEEQVKTFTNSPAYHPELWIMAIHRQTREAVGCGISDFDRESGEGSLEWIQVLPAWQRQHIGQGIVAELLIRMKGFARFATVSGKQNDPSRPELLYRACGFTGTDVWHILKK